MTITEQPPSASVAADDYWWYQARGPLLEAALGAYLPAGADVLDVGSADGPSARWIRRPASRVVSIDLHRSGLSGSGVVGSAMELPFADGSFDAVCAFDVIEHCEPEAGALREIHRVLRPGGVFLMAVPAYEWAWSEHDVASGHHRRYTTRRARAAVQRAGLTVERASYGFAGVFPLFAAQRLASRARHAVAPPPDIAILPRTSRPVHHLLMGLCRIDQRLLGRVDLPFGSSVFLAARRAP